VGPMVVVLAANKGAQEISEVVHGQDPPGHTAERAHLQASFETSSSSPS
jgi:hypothetical protein